MERGATCYIPVTDERLHMGPGEPEGYVKCWVTGPTLDCPGSFDLEDAREAQTPAGNAPWGCVPAEMCLPEIPKGGKELL